MALRDEIVRRIAKKKREINDLDVKMKAAASYIQALEDTLKMLPPDDQDSPPVAQVDLRSGSRMDRAREILRSAGKPLHILRILGAMGEKPDAENRASLAGSLGAYVRDGKIFTRPAPNTFGLLELNGNGETVEAPEPPPGFGHDEETEAVGKTDDDVPF